MHAAFKRCDHAETKTIGQDNTALCLKHFGFPLAVLGNKKLIRPTNQVILHGFFPDFDSREFQFMSNNLFTLRLTA
jgi:hypothetical protein